MIQLESKIKIILFFFFVLYIILSIIKFTVQKIFRSHPVRGHSYLECNKNVTLWKLKKNSEIFKEHDPKIQKGQGDVSVQIVYN